MKSCLATLLRLQGKTEGLSPYFGGNSTFLFGLAGAYRRMFGHRYLIGYGAAFLVSTVIMPAQARTETFDCQRFYSVETISTNVTRIPCIPQQKVTEISLVTGAKGIAIEDLPDNVGREFVISHLGCLVGIDQQSSCSDFGFWTQREGNGQTGKLNFGKIGVNGSGVEVWYASGRQIQDAHVVTPIYRRSTARIFDHGRDFPVARPNNVGRRSNIELIRNDDSALTLSQSVVSFFQSVPLKASYYRVGGSNENERRGRPYNRITKGAAGVLICLVCVPWGVARIWHLCKTADGESDQCGNERQYALISAVLVIAGWLSGVYGGFLLLSLLVA